MKLTAICLLLFCLHLSARTVSQTITLSGKNLQLSQILDSIERQTKYIAFYDEDVIANSRPVTITAVRQPLVDFLNEVLSGQLLTFAIKNTSIIISRKEAVLSPRSITAPAITFPITEIPTITIMGKIVNEKGEPVEGVSIVVRGKSNGTSTNASGEFSLKDVDENASLEVSYIGYASQIIRVNNRTTIDIVLSLALKLEDDIVVVGYGTQKKATLTGSVVSTSGAEVLKSPATNLSNTLVGRLPGLIGFTRSGEPGNDATTLMIRGSNTLGDNSPLIVVDGIAGRDFSRLNPADIENISVLKDASAAIYGARAANGVILVTTKRGKTGKPRISATHNTGFQRPTVIPEMADAATYASMLNEIAFYNNESLGMFQRFSEEDIQKYRDRSDPWGHPNTNWFKEVLKPWSLQHYDNVSISGGTDNVKYFLSVGARSQDGVYRNSGTKYKEYNVRSNIDAKINKYISVALDLAGSQEDKDFAVTDVFSIWRSTFRGKPNTPAFWPNGTPGPSFLEFGDQPVVTSTKANGYRLDKWFKLQTNGRINVIIPWISGLTLQGNISVDKAFNNVKEFHKPWYLYNWDGNSDHITVPGKVGIVAPTLTQSTNEALQITMNSYLSYDHTFNGVHNVRAQAGVEKQTIDTAFVTARRENFLSPAVDQLFAGAADEFMTNNGSALHSSRLSYFGRLGYDFSNKYLLEFTWRYDGSYIFPKAKRFGFFPGVAGAWRVSKEKFWQENIRGIDEFKLRASWGQTGNDRITPFQYLSTYGFSGNYIYNVDDQVNNLVELRVPNPNVTWEVANQSNVAMEMGFLNNRLAVTLEYFYNVRSQILWIRNASIPASGGLRLPPENIGKVNNKGWEAIVEYRGSLGQFKYNAFLSGSYQKNKIVFWDETPGVPEYQKSTGRPMGSQLHYVSLGIFSDQGAVDKYPHWPGARPGDVIYQDVNGDNEINGLDQVRNTKSDQPTFTGSFSLNLQYKQFDLSLLVQGASGSQKYITIEGGESGNYYKLWADNRWTSENTRTSYARTWDQTVPYWDNTRNSYWLYSSDYVRLKNVEIGYTLPLGLSKRIRIDGMRVYLSALNLFTVSELTKKKMMDPESLDNYAYPLNKVLNVGLTLNF